MVLASQQRRPSSRSSGSMRNSRGKSATGKLVGMSMLALVVVAGSAWYLKPEWFKKKPVVGAQMASNLPAEPQVQAQMGVGTTAKPGSVQPGAMPVAPTKTIAPPVATREPVKTQSGPTPSVVAQAPVKPEPAKTEPVKSEPVKHVSAAPATSTQAPAPMMQTGVTQTQTPAQTAGVNSNDVAKAMGAALDKTGLGANAAGANAGAGAAQGTPGASTGAEQAQALPSVPKVVELPANMSVPDRMAKGMELIGDGKLVDGRRVLSALLTAPDAALLPMDAQAIRDTLQSINQKLIFSKEIDPTDPLVEQYVIKPGDFLAKLARRNNVPFEFLEYINNTTAKKVQIGQKIKLVKGPFHAVVDKSAFRMDIFVDEPAGSRVYVRSFQVGHGTDNGTPTGAFVIRSQGKVTNPLWINPHTGEHFASDDPKNPIGEYWLGLQGTTPETANVPGYGIHGTVDPDSIGKQSSMGCVRLRDEDIKLVYFMLQDGQSTVVILP